MAAMPASAKDGQYGIGTPATASEIAGWDIDIRPDGKGLPAGSGSVDIQVTMNASEEYLIK